MESNKSELEFHNAAQESLFSEKQKMILERHKELDELNRTETTWNERFDLIHVRAFALVHKCLIIYYSLLISVCQYCKSDGARCNKPMPH